MFYVTWFRNSLLRVSEAEASQAMIPWTAFAIVVCTLAWAIPAVSQRIARVLDAIRTPAPGTRRIATVLIAIAAAGYFYGTAVEFDRLLMPVWHDSYMHMVQARLLTHGKFWAAQHPLADHLETFFVFVKPVYAAIHFPGTSMLYAPLLAMGVPPAVFSALMAGAIVALTYRIVAELIDGVAAALVVPLMLGMGPLRQASVMLLSHHTLVVPALLAVWAFLHWRRAPGGATAWAGALGAFVGFAGITRPVEALVYAIALGLGIFWTLRGQPWRRWLVTAGMIVACAAPFLVLQGVIDYHVTGKVLLTPYDQYVRLFHPRTSFTGFEEVNTGPITLPTNLPQKVDYYVAFIVPYVRDFERFGAWAMLWHERVPLTIAGLTPHPLVVALWVPALLGLRSVGRRVLVLTIPLLLVFYLPNLFFLNHYAVAVAPAGALLAVLGMHVVGRTFPRGEGVGGRQSAEVLIAPLLLAAGVAGLPQVNRNILELPITWAKDGVYANTRMAQDVQQPAAVLFRYRAPDQPFDPAIDVYHDEPVYTFDVERPEDSPVARFQDLGAERNRALYKFFADREPNRHFYLFDRHYDRMIPLGTARELSERGEPPSYFLSGPTLPPEVAKTAISTTRPADK